MKDNSYLEVQQCLHNQDKDPHKDNCMEEGNQSILCDSFLSHAHFAKASQILIADTHVSLTKLVRFSCTYTFHPVQLNLGECVNKINKQKPIPEFQIQTKLE